MLEEHLIAEFVRVSFIDGLGREEKGAWHVESDLEVASKRTSGRRHWTKRSLSEACKLSSARCPAACAQ
jgi:hypothetical protein